MRGVKRRAPGTAPRVGMNSNGVSDADSDLNDTNLPPVSQSTLTDGDGEHGELNIESGGDGTGGGAASGGGSQGNRQKAEQLDEVPLVIPAAVCKDNKASLLVHMRDETLNFSGDTGAIGRISVHGRKSKGSRLTFDLKGQQFDGQIVPSATVLIVGVGMTEARVEGIFSEVCRLDYKGNVLDSMGGQVLKGKMDESYKFEDEDLNARGNGVADGEAASGGSGVGRSSGGRAPMSSRKTATSRGKKGVPVGKKGVPVGKKAIRSSSAKTAPKT